MEVALGYVRFVPRCEPRLRGRPNPTAIHAAILGLRDLNQRLLGHRIDRVVIGLEAEGERHRSLLFVEEMIGLVHGHKPGDSDTLLRAVAEVGLVARGGKSPAVGSRLMRHDRPLRGDESGVLHHSEVVRVCGIVLDSEHQAADLVKRV